MEKAENVVLNVQHEKKLLTLLKKKLGFFEAILDLTHDEKKCDIPEWISALEQKKVLLSCIDEIDDEISFFKATFHDLSQDISEQLDKIRDTVQEILKLDSENYEKRKQEYDEHF